ncbi:hypothetical protein BDV09DRAFT_125710 [Aspergillus tetrazonus]
MMQVRIAGEILHIIVISMPLPHMSQEANYGRVPPSFADCDLCGKRACFIFLRRCDTIESCDRRSQEERRLWRGTANGLPPTKARMLCKTNCLEKYAPAPL